MWRALGSKRWRLKPDRDGRRQTRAAPAGPSGPDPLTARVPSRLSGSVRPPGEVPRLALMFDATTWPSSDS